MKLKNRRVKNRKIMFYPLIIGSLLLLLSSNTIAHNDYGPFNVDEAIQCQEDNDAVPHQACFDEGGPNDWTRINGGQDVEGEWLYVKFDENDDFSNVNFSSTKLKEARFRWYSGNSACISDVDVFLWTNDDPDPTESCGGSEECCVDDVEWEDGDCEDYFTVWSKAEDNSYFIDEANDVGNCNGPYMECDSGYLSSYADIIRNNASWDQADKIAILFWTDHAGDDKCLIPDGGQSGYQDIIELYVRWNEPPALTNCPGNVTTEDSNENTTIDLWPCHSDSDDSDSSNTFGIFSQLNPNLVNCTIDQDRYLNCAPPMADQNGFTEVVVNVSDGYDTAMITISVNVTSVNDAPYFVTNTTVSQSESNTTDQGASVLFRADIMDVDDNDNVNFLVCDSVGLSGSVCSNQTYCNFNSTKDGYKSCSFDTSNLTVSSFSWSSFACDEGGLCANSIIGTYSVNLRPNNVKVNLENTMIFNGTGFFSGPSNIRNFEKTLEQELKSCQENLDGSCTINLSVTSSTIGKINLSNLKIYYAPPEILFNLTNLTDDMNNTIITFQILNNNLSAGNFGWDIDFRDGTTASNSTTIYLETNEDIFVIAQHNYALAGQYNITVNATRGIITNSKILTIEVI